MSLSKNLTQYPPNWDKWPAGLARVISSSSLKEEDVAMDQEKLDRLNKLVASHPVLSLVIEAPNFIVTSHLYEFIEYELHTGNKKVPYNLTEFFGDYLNFLVVRYLRHHRSQYAPKHFRWNIRDTVDKLSKVAFLSFIRDIKITEPLLARVLPNNILEATSEEKQPDLTFRALGLVERDTDRPHKRPVYRFRENCILHYLVAHFQALECLRKATNKQTVVTTAMRECMRRLPITGDIWRMTFGLLNMDSITRDVQKEVMQALIQESKKLPSISSFEITSMCVEAIYESQNGGELATLFDEFTLNQTISYTNQFLKPDRLAYAMCAVGYLVRASPEVYGVHMSNFNLGPSAIAMLADPVNAISDNNLQVLNLSYNPIGSTGMKRLQRFLVKATLLTHIDLTCCDLGDLGCALLSEFFLCMPIRYLRLTENKIGDRGVIHMCANLKYVPTLEWLDLSNNVITDRGTSLLGEALPLLPYLRSLDLRRNRIGDNGVDSISRNMGTLNQVTQLMLSENMIGENGAEKLADHVWKTKSLRYVNLSLNNIPQSGIMGLRKAAYSHGNLHIQVDSQSFELLSTNGRSDPNLSGTKETLDGEPKEGEAYITTPSSVDLLAGRPEDPLAPVKRRHPHRRRSLPRLDDFRRSWHGATHSLRDSLRRGNRIEMP